MSGFQTLDVIIGLFFVYTILSLVVTAANEFVAQMVDLRGKTLFNGIRMLLEGTGKGKDTVVEEARGTQRLDAATLKKAAPTEFKEAKDSAAELAKAEAAAAAATQRSTAAATLARDTKTDLAAQVAVAAAEELEKAREAARQARDNAQAKQTALMKAARISDSAAVSAALPDDVRVSTRTIATERLYSHPLIAGLRTRGRLITRLRHPSYIPSHTFAATLLDLVVPGDGSTPKSVESIRASVLQLPEQVQRPLLVIIDQAQGDLRAVHVGIERWFNDAMERVSGLYKRRTQLIILVISLLITVLANADSVRIWRTLSSSSTLRAAVVADAQRFLSSRPAGLTGRDSASPAGASSSTERANTPAARPSFEPVRAAADRIDSLAARGVPLGWPNGPSMPSIPGLLITALAISLGAPFWFDMLNKVVNVRAAGRAPEEKPKSPEALPPPRGP